jgi:L-amino acid N-acyltransferase YncA
MERAAMHIRPARDADLDAILAIHNDAILNSTAIWTDEPVTRREREAWFRSHRDAGEPVLVMDVDGHAVGYATYSQWRGKSGYRFSVEDSIYIAGSHQGQGIGRLLLVELIARAKDAGKHLMIADIEAGNAASIHLHESLGFVQTGFIREVGTKFDRWLDLAILQLEL